MANTVGPSQPARLLSWLRQLPWLKIVPLAIGGVVLFVLIMFGVAYLTVDIPPANRIVTAQATVIQYADGTQFGRIGVRNRTAVPLSKVSKPAQQAVLAAEDRNYYDEPGISFTGILRSLWADVSGGDVSQGGSTITQQYAKNAFLSQERTFTRKFKEIVIAVKLDHQRSKQEVLTDYLNTIYFGRGAYGIEAAAQAYFGIPASKLDFEQGAVLAALIRGPALYDPADHPDAAHQRFQYVLSGLVDINAISKGQARAASYPKVKPQSNVDQLGGPTGYLVRQVENELEAHGFSEDRIRRSGLVVQTTVDRRMQAAAQKAVSDVLAGTPGDLLSPLVAIVPGTGAIRAEYGGRDYVKRQLNAATQGIAQAGSSFKPYVLAAALQQGIGLSTTYDGSSPQTFGDYTVHNYNNEQFGRIDLRTATAESVNTVFVHLALDAKLSNVRQVAKLAGITTPIPKNDATIAIGTASVHPIDQAEAYATFAAQGVHAKSYLVEKVLDPDGNTVYSAEHNTNRIFSAAVGADLTSALQGVIEHGTATAAQLANGRPAAGKTGTTSGNTAAWFCGYTPQLATAVGLFFDPIKPLQGIAGVDEVVGGSLPARIWKQFMDTALAGAPKQAFPPPANVGGAPQRDSEPHSRAPAPTDTGPVVPTSAPALPTGTPSPTPSGSSLPPPLPSQVTAPPTRSPSPIPTPSAVPVSTPTRAPSRTPVAVASSPPPAGGVVTRGAGTGKQTARPTPSR